jgi:glutamine amidotransferase
VTVPTNSTLTIHKQTVMVHPIIDQYYNQSPSYSRSSKFVVEKGLVANEKSAMSRGVSPLPTPGPLSQADESKKGFTPTKMHETMARNISSAGPTYQLPRDYSQEQLKKHSLNGALTDIRRVTSPSGRDPARPQELGNTKKKRRSLMDMEPPAPPVVAEPEQEPEPVEPQPQQPSTPEDRSYGDPVKIAQYFPELALS